MNPTTDASAGVNRTPATAASTLTLLAAAGILAPLMILSGCSSPRGDSSAAQHPAGAPVVAPLRVAVAPDYPPLVFQQGDSITGAEADLARELGRELNRPVEFVTCKRQDLITMLQDGQADIVMSGMSVTRARELRATFTEPYLQNQIRAVFRRAEADRYQSADDIRSTTSRIGVLPGTTSDAFVQRNCPDATRVALQYRRDAVFWLTDGGKVDVYVDDLFALAQMVSEKETLLAFLQEPLSTEDLAWAVAPGDPALLAKVNEILARWKSDGTLDRTLQRWMPYLKPK